MSKPRVRFAPSPTGYLHVGGLRTALYNYLFARHNGGTCILRIEDTDQAREVADAQKNLLSSLKWAGIEFDEGPDGIGGEFGPYIQSQRTELYQKYANQLVEAGQAYYCFCTEDELTKMREEQLAKKQDTRYDGRCRDLSLEEIKEKLDQNTPYVVRLKIKREGTDYQVNDLVRGTVTFSPDQIDDQVLLKSDGFPTYHLAHVVDDHLMEVSHVIRGEEWLPSTPKHLQLFEYLGWEPPQYAHLPLLLNPDRSKLSKRQGDVATEDYQKKGFLPDALLNFVALLGWHSAEDKEIYPLQELIEEFSLERVGKAGAVFDVDKLKWMNQQYIKQKTPEEVLDLLQPFLPEAAKTTEQDELNKIVGIVKDSLVTLTDITDRLELFFNDSPILKDENLAQQIKSEDAQTVFREFLKQLDETDEISAENFGKTMKAIQKQTGIKGKHLWIPVRIAITHTEHGPDLAAVVDVFGKEKCARMIRNALGD